MGDGGDCGVANPYFRDAYIDVSGDPDQGDAVSCGPGTDAVTADPSDSIAADCEAVTIVAAG